MQPGDLPTTEVCVDSGVTEKLGVDKAGRGEEAMGSAELQSLANLSY